MVCSNAARKSSKQSKGRKSERSEYQVADGKMTDAPIPTPEPDPNPNPDPEVKNGIVNEDGELYYYVDGVKTYAGQEPTLAIRP